MLLGSIHRVQINARTSIHIYISIHELDFYQHTSHTHIYIHYIHRHTKTHKPTTTTTMTGRCAHALVIVSGCFSLQPRLSYLPACLHRLIFLYLPTPSPRELSRSAAETTKKPCAASGMSEQQWPMSAWLRVWPPVQVHLQAASLLPLKVRKY